MTSDYCPYCRRVTPQIKDKDKKLCKRCGRISKRLYGNRSMVSLRPLGNLVVSGATIGVGVGLLGSINNAFSK